MDSGNNSGSLQSSSCGADEQDYDSRAAAADDSMFMSTTTTTTSVNTTHPPQHLLFDPFSNYNNMQVLHHNNSSSSSSLLHTNYMENWPRPGTLRSDPNHHMTNPPSNFQQRPTTAAAGEDIISGGVGPTRKKRSRASRRAPTTVLTTDTTNFRAMVQEFTGIPAPPFSTSSNNSFHPTRLDLFRSTAPPYLRRPFPHKPPHDSPTAPPLSSASTTPAMVNYQQLPIITNNIVPPINNPHHLQTNPNTSFLFTNSLVTASKPHQFDTQPSNYHLIAGLPNLISSDQISSPHNHHNSNNAAGTGTNWAAVNNNNTNSDGLINGHDPVKHNGGDDRPSNIDNIIAMTTAGSSQGMVESWICSSD